MLKEATLSKKEPDYLFLWTVIVMAVIGTVFVYSSSFAIAANYDSGNPQFYLINHFIRLVLSFVFFGVFAVVDYRRVVNLGGLAYIVSLILLIVVLFLPGDNTVNGARRWINLGFMNFQVSEFAKIALVLTIIRSVTRDPDMIRTRNGFVRELSKIGIVSFLIMLEPDFSTALIVGIIGLALLYMAGAKLLHVFICLIVTLPVAAAVMAIKSYRIQRVLSFFNADGAEKSMSYQLKQSLIGLGNGGIFGRGLGQGEQKYFFLPEPHTDFVFSIIGEEIGFIGCIAILGLFSFLTYRGIRIAVDAPEIKGRLLTAGLVFTIFIYVIMHTFVNTGIIPTTGVPLPFLSYGGTNLLLVMSSMGIVLNVSRMRSTERIYRG